MTTQEQENFYRHSTVIVDETKDSFLHLLVFHLTNQGITLQRFIEVNGHDIYHLCFNRYPCCQCPPGTRTETRGNRILHPPQMNILFDKTGNKLPMHNPGSKSAPHCCCPVNPNLQLQDLDFTLARFLLVNFTTLVPQGSPERIALDDLVNSRNHSFAHAKEGKMSNSEYQKSMAEIEKSLLVLAKVYGKETETKQRLGYIAKQPLNSTICLQYHNTLLQQCQLEEAIKQLLAEKKLPDCLTTDLSDVIVTEGCDAHFEIRTKENGLCSQWFQDGVEIVRSEKFIAGMSGKIHSMEIRNTLLSDKGLYTVRIQDIERQAHLYVEEYFTKNLQSVECIEGEIAEFTCEVKEDSLPAHWNKNGIQFKNDGKYEILQAGKIHRLSIKKCDQHDTANYTVSINNRVRATSLVVIEYFTKPLGTMTCTEGGTVQFECEVLDDNQKAVWFKDGTEVSTSDRYKVERDGKLHRLVINNVRLDDKGEYSVQIKHCVRQTKLTVQEIPKAIQQLSVKDKELYIEIIKSGTEMRYYIRVVIIGENGVGKTCLLRRLLKQSIMGVQSTDGVDMHRCKINLSNGQWIFDYVSDKKKELLLRLKKAKNSSSGDKNFLLESYPQSSYYVTGLEDDENSHINIRESTGTSRNSSGRKETIHDKLEDESGKSEIKQQMMTPPMHNISDDREMHVKNTSQLHHDFVTKLLNEEVSQALDDFFNGIEEVDIPSDVFVECGLLDFAGEKEYYATHPIFLNPNAIHLLVANIMKDVQPIKTEDGFDKIGEYVDFWLDSIHCCGVNEETKTEFLYPPTIIVCTRTDECRDHLEERKQVFCKQLGSVLRNESKKKHIREICYVSNTESKEEDISGLRDTIFKYGKQLKTFAEQLPLKWIRLEHLIDVFRESGVNILSRPDIVKLSSKCSIDSENEINLFLKYQHKVGNVIYFESLKEYIILNQKWLANAFRCLVSDKFDSNLILSDEWRALEDTGKLEHSLIVKLFEKEPELDFNRHSGHLLNVMEIFGIIVKLRTLMENGQRKILPTYYMPCMISEKASLTDIIDRFNVKKKNCKCTPWLCIEFDFMPLDFFNHILCHYINQYAMCTEPQIGRMAIYHGIGVFFLDSTKFRKFVLCFCKNTIALQIWLWRDIKKGTCKAMLDELKETIMSVKEKFETRRVFYTVKSKCSNGNIHISAGRHSHSELVNLGDEYFCEEHSDSHNTQDFFKTWFEDYTENEDYVPAGQKLKGQEGIQDTRFKQKCHVCDKEPSVYWCHDCQRSMCQDCNNQHMESTDTKYHIVQHVQDMYSLDYNFGVNVKQIWDIKVLHDVLVIADYSGKQLVTCDITGQQQHTIPLPGVPRRIAVVDNNTVAVTVYTTLPTTTVVIVDVRQRQVIQHIDVKVGCGGIMYRDNQLFVGCEDRTIKVMNMSGKVTRTIPVGVYPGYICGGEAGRIYYTDHVKLYCIDTVGNTLFTFTDPNMSGPLGITTDDEGHVLVICDGSNNVLRISPDGKQSQVIITQIPQSQVIITQTPLSGWFKYPYICYNSLSKSVFIGCHDNVYVYKKV